MAASGASRPSGASGPSDASGPDARDARVPCPLCGGLIHPIAGRCKHCKADLSAYRSARPAASAPLPPLHPAATAGNGVSGPIAHAVAMPPAAQAVLPPRPRRASTGRPAGSAWRSWPVVVIVVAMMAIVAAVVLMVWPITRGAAGKRPLPPPPAPERMDNQLPPVMPKVTPQPAPGHAPADPSGGPHASAPAAPALPDDLARSDQATLDDDPGSDDAIGAAPAAPAAPQGHRALSQNGGGLLQVAMAARLCRKLARCGSTDSTMKDMCEQIASMGVPLDPPPGCPAAERCLRRIDAMGCSSQPDALQIGLMMMQFSDCVAAMRC